MSALNKVRQVGVGRFGQDLFLQRVLFGFLRSRPRFRRDVVARGAGPGALVPRPAYEPLEGLRIERFAPNQFVRDQLQWVAMLLQDVFGFGASLVEDPLHFLIDFFGGPRAAEFHLGPWAMQSPPGWQ